jgi:hypothetical protein
MANVIAQLATQLPQDSLPPPVHGAGEALRALIDADAYVGEAVSLSYNEAILQIQRFSPPEGGGHPGPLLC